MTTRRALRGRHQRIRAKCDEPREDLAGQWVRAFRVLRFRTVRVRRLGGDRRSILRPLSRRVRSDR